MVHPGIVAFGVIGVVVTGVVIYTIFKEELSDYLESREKPSPVASGYEQPNEQQQQQQRGFAQDDYDFDQGHSSSMYHNGYELRQRQTLRPNEDEDENEKDDPENDVLLQKLRRINEARRAIAADEERLAEMERAMKEREENLRRSMIEQEERENELRESIQRNIKREQELVAIQHQELQMSQASEIYQNPFASNEPLIRDYSDNDSQHDQIQQTTAAPEVSSRAANAILRHDLSVNHQENLNPFEDPSSLLENASSSSTRSSVHGNDDVDAFADAEEQSMTVHDDDDDLEWTEAEVGSVGSEESDESWGSTSH
ncbi:hypothetical protein BGZ79_010222 [Entomortierella chlamydospora]|nr:hypothetical protein BGZ79_010222 [Entomortierella chlamydospora]